MPILARLADEANALSKRAYCDYGYYYSYGGCYYSSWNYWGRWVLLAVIVVVAFLIFLIFSCTQARRRRRRGQQPLMGTGWMAPQGHGQAQYTGGQQYPMQNNYGPPPPSYPAQANSGANADYYAQDSGVTAPGQAYQPQRGGEPVYVPPEGPPPGKH